MQKQTREDFGIAAAAMALAVATNAFAQTQGPNGEPPTPTSEITLTDAEVAKVKEGKHTAALLWHTSSDFVNAVTAGATDEFTRLGIRGCDDRCRLRRGEAEERHRDGARQESERHPRPAARSDDFGRGLPAGGRGGDQDRAPVERPGRLRPGQGLRRHRHRRPLPDGQAGRRRARRGDRQEGQGRLDLPRRAVLRDQPARQRLQDDHREGLSRHRDRRRAGPRRSGARRGDRQRAPPQEPRSRRHLRHLGGAGGGRARGAACGRQHPDQDRHARPLRADRARHGARAATSSRSSPTRPTSSAAPWRRSAAYGLLGKAGAALHRRAGDRP